MYASKGHEKTKNYEKKITEVQLEKRKLLLIVRSGVVPCILYVDDVILSLLDMPQIKAFTYILVRQSHTINPVQVWSQ